MGNRSCLSFQAIQGGFTFLIKNTLKEVAKVFSSICYGSFFFLAEYSIIYAVPLSISLSLSL